MDCGGDDDDDLGANEEEVKVKLMRASVNNGSDDEQSRGLSLLVDAWTKFKSQVLETGSPPGR